jgi:hypothetical protein
MLTKAEKLNRWWTFINSNQFGSDTYTVIFLLGTNVRNTITTIELYGGLLSRKLDDGTFNDVIPSTAPMTVIKQHIVLDMILKTEIIIESFLVFFHHLSQRHDGLGDKMAFYDQKLVETIIAKVRKRRDFNMRGALGLADISDLPIDKDERKVLAYVYRESENAAWDALDKMVEFYDKFKMIYHKSKHGLTFQTGSTETTTPASQFEKSALIAYHRKSADDKPMGYIEVEPEDLEAPKWFNRIAHLNFGQNLMGEIFTVTEAMKQIVPYVCRSHLIFAANSGEGYLPYQTGPDNNLIVDFLVRPTANVAELRRIQPRLNSIISKISPNMVTNEQEFGVNTSYKNPKLERSIKNNTVTNMRYKETETEKINSEI